MRIVSDLNYCAWLRATRPDGHWDPQYIASVIDEGMTIAHFVPSMLAAFSAMQPDGWHTFVQRRLKKVECGAWTKV
jgi:hypothetical protein